MHTRRRATSESGQSGDSLHVLLYRYFFFEWLFRDVNDGSSLERAAAWRFNREMRRYLLIYLRRWAMLVVSSYTLGAWLEQGLALGHAATFFYCVTCISAAMSMLIVRSWLGLRYG
jgi:hypothetical protein